ncbi:hypothetical protein FCV25MIE_00629 [Fagus crenata]
MHYSLAYFHIYIYIYIMYLEDGHIIDCIDIHNQPALDHPLLKNHIVQPFPYTT